MFKADPGTDPKMDRMLRDLVAESLQPGSQAGEGREARREARNDEVLTPARRQAVLDAAEARARPLWLPSLPVAGRWGLLGSTAALALVFAALVFQGGGTVRHDPDARLAAPAAVSGLQVVSDGDAVTLHWDAADSGSYRVIRATNPRDLSAEDGEIGEIVEGNSWTDPKRNGSKVVYYRVEEVEG